MRRKVWLAALVLSVPLTSGFTPPLPGGPVHAAPAGSGPSDYIEYHPGTLPLILTVPHGGTLEPPDLPDRISGNAGRYDTNTLELGRAIVEVIRQKTGRTPYLVIDHLHRKKLDTNRDMLEAAQDEPAAVAIWEAWHACIDSAKDAVERSFGTGLLIDLHGHRHREPWVELGYLLSNMDLAQPDSVLNKMSVADMSSIGTLLRSSPHAFADIIRGPMSLGGMLEDQGYPSVPGPLHPHPGGKGYFSGGYNTERHGSMGGGRIAAVQLEVPWENVRDTKSNRVRFAEAAAEAFIQFMETHCVPAAE
jgi:N-formylglutamate amidohydrolase